MAEKLAFKPLLPEGDYPAECTVVQFEVQKNPEWADQYKFSFELWEPHAGREMVYWASVPKSERLTPNTKLGRAYTILAEPKSSVADVKLEDCVGGQCLLHIIQDERIDKKSKAKNPGTIVFNKVESIEPMPQGMRRPKL